MPPRGASLVDSSMFALVQILPLVFLPLTGWLLWLGWSEEWRKLGVFAAGFLVLAALICFGPFVGRTPLGHGARWDALGALLYFGIVMMEVVAATILAAILAMIHRRVYPGGRTASRG